MKPKRIQLSRKKGWRMPANTVKVTRPGPFGNPIRIGDYFMDGDPRGAGPLRMAWCVTSKEYADSRYTHIDSAAKAVDAFRTVAAHWSAKKIAPLRGKNLACWCKLGEPCHADVLLEIANAAEQAA